MTLPFKTISDIPQVAGKKILVRVDFNVPIRDGRIINDFRIRKTLPTLHKLKKSGAQLILMSHLSGNMGKSLAPIARHLKSEFPLKLMSLIEAREQGDTKDGSVILLENIRQDPREIQNDTGFAQELAGLADLYVNEAFSVSHRAHTSIVGVPKLLPAYAGGLFSEEYTSLKEMDTPEHPFVLIVAGAKFDTKIPLIQAFLDTADTVFVGGALANTFLKARGYKVGTSLVSDVDVKKYPLLLDERILLPKDVEIENSSGTSIVSRENVGEHDSILDAGQQTMDVLKEKVRDAKTILWNGPLGNYESGFNRRSLELAKMLTESKAYTVVGGGDTVIAVTDTRAEDGFSFVSTGGGAMIQFLADGTLPGIEALKQ
jgi:phosphoglycerate kinase